MLGGQARSDAGQAHAREMLAAVDSRVQLQHSQTNRVP
jgi:hypothetical protein